MVCRVCLGAMFHQPLLQYTNMPAAAQGFPTKETLNQDVGANVEVVQCASCGLVQLSNQPVSYYKDVIRASAYSDEMRVFRLAQFKAWAEKYQLIGQSVLEVGCGRGEYLALLKSVGLNAYGVEHAAEAVADCQQQGLQATQGYFGDFKLAHKASNYAGFVCLNFMEHWPNPRASLQEIHAHLAENAIGLIEVPNFDMILKKGLFSEFIADHLLYFTQQTLTQTLQNNGFEVLECQPVWQDYILSAVVRKRPATHLDYFDQFKKRISAELNAFVDEYAIGKVAVWGAGHQALAVIALAELSKKIAYVVDSAPFKQGKYTPATHIEIVAPSYIISQPVDAIIVMAASYSDEVAKLIIANHGKRMNVVILRDNGLEQVG